MNQGWQVHPELSPIVCLPTLQSPIMEVNGKAILIQKQSSFGGHDALSFLLDEGYVTCVCGIACVCVYICVPLFKDFGMFTTGLVSFACCMADLAMMSTIFLVASSNSKLYGTPWFLASGEQKMRRLSRTRANLCL